MRYQKKKGLVAFGGVPVASIPALTLIGSAVLPAMRSAARSGASNLHWLSPPEVAKP
jgi:hypothetical protein